MKSREILYPERSARIAEVGAVQTFRTREGTTMYGAEIVLDNGDAFSHWTTDKYALDFFKEGTYLIYRIKKIIEGEGTSDEKIKVKLDTYDFVLPRKVRAEIGLPEKLSNSITESVNFAASMLQNMPDLYSSKTKLDVPKYTMLLSEIASSIHQCKKHMLIAENYGDAEI